MIILRRTLSVVMLCMTTLAVAAYAYSTYEVSRLEQQYPPVGTLSDVDGTTLHYVDSGTGDPIVLLHGASSSLMDFEASIALPLRKNFRVISIDRPGYGYSRRHPGQWNDPAIQARLVNSLLRRLGVERATFVGHSLGGAVVMAYALAYPQQTTRIVLLGGATHPWESGVAWSNHVATWPVIGTVFRHTMIVPAGTVLLPKALAEVFTPNPVTPNYAEDTRVRLALRPEPFFASAQDLLRLSPYLEKQSQLYASIDLPLLLITGSADTIVPAWNHSNRLIKILSNATLIELPDTGHVPHHAQTRLVVKNIEEFIRQL